jgi:hypothetical protein
MPQRRALHRMPILSCFSRGRILCGSCQGKSWQKLGHKKMRRGLNPRPDVKQRRLCQLDAPGFQSLAIRALNSFSSCQILSSRTTMYSWCNGLGSKSNQKDNRAAVIATIAGLVNPCLQTIHQVANRCRSCARNSAFAAGDEPSSAIVYCTGFESIKEASCVPVRRRVKSYIWQPPFALLQKSISD